MPRVYPWLEFTHRSPHSHTHLPERSISVEGMWGRYTPSKMTGRREIKSHESCTPDIPAIAVTVQCVEDGLRLKEVVDGVLQVKETIK